MNRQEFVTCNPVRKFENSSIRKGYKYAVSGDDILPRMEEFCLNEVFAERGIKW